MNNKKTKLDHFGMMLSHIDPAECEQAIAKSQNFGEPVFTVKDLGGTTFPIAILLRLLFLRENMTWEKFTTMHRNFALRTQMSANQINYSRNNLRRALQSPTAGWNNLEHWLNISGCEMIDLSLTFKQPNGEIVTIRKSDADKLYQEYEMQKHASDPEDNGGIPPVL